MKSIFKNLIKNSAILSIPGLISIFISLISIPIHLNYAGQESYGNYIIFHFILMIWNVLSPCVEMYRALEQSLFWLDVLVGRANVFGRRT